MTAPQSTRFQRLFRNQYGLVGETIKWLFIFDILLGLAHILWPDYEWGDERSSYFYFGNSRTLASWFSAMKLLLIGLFLFFAHRKGKIENRNNQSGFRYIWISGGIISIMLSILEMTRIHQKLSLYYYPSKDIFQTIVVTISQLLILGFFFFFFMKASQGSTSFSWALKLWAALWGIAILVEQFISFIPGNLHVPSWLIAGLGALFGETVLLLFLGCYVLEGKRSVGI